MEEVPDSLFSFRRVDSDVLSVEAFREEEIASLSPATY